MRLNSSPGEEHLRFQQTHSSIVSFGSFQIFGEHLPFFLPFCSVLSNGALCPFLSNKLFLFSVQQTITIHKSFISLFCAFPFFPLSSKYWWVLTSSLFSIFFIPWPMLLPTCVFSSSLWIFTINYKCILILGNFF